MILVACATDGDDAAVSLADLPWSPPIAAALLPSLPIGRVLLSLPSSAVTVLRSCDRLFSAHQRRFHAHRLCDTLRALQQPAVPVDRLQRLVDDLCDRALRQEEGEDDGKEAREEEELLLTVLAVRTASSSALALLGHVRRAAPVSAQSLPRWRVAVHGHRRWLAGFKHSQWAKDRHALQFEVIKTRHELQELVLHQGDALLEGLVTNIAAIDRQGAILTSTVRPHGQDQDQGQLLPGYFRSLLLEHPMARECDALTIQEIREGKYAALVCIGTGCVLAAVDSIVLPDTDRLARCQDGQCQCLPLTDNEAGASRCHHFSADTEIVLDDGVRVPAQRYVADLLAWLLAAFARPAAAEE